MKENEKDTLGWRMKSIENESKVVLEKKVPVIIRLDGKAFHSFTKGLNKPFDSVLQRTMQRTTVALCSELQNVKFAYTQSDEISILLWDNAKEKTSAWFDNKLQKMVSVSASLATLYFNNFFREEFNKVVLEENYGIEYIDKLDSKLGRASFDSRAFSIDEDEIVNYFIWRQNDCIKNSISMVAQANFSHKQLHGVNSENKIKMLLEKDVDYYEDYTEQERKGSFVVKTPIEIEEGVFRNKWFVPATTVVVSKNREYLREKFV